jgi:hypothetical protein
MPHSIAVAATIKKHESLAFMGLCLVVQNLRDEFLRLAPVV